MFLDNLRQLLGGLGIGAVKDLGARIDGRTELILMNADKDGTRIFLHQLQTVFQV